MLAALVVGGLTAWYLGIQAGVIAAIATAGALLLAAFIPGMTIAVYALILAWTAALYFLGPKIGKSKDAQAAGGLGALGGALNQATAWVKKAMGQDSSRK